MDTLAITEVVEPVLAAFDADLLLVSAGQDPGIVDPLGRNLVTKSGFEMLGAHARRLAEQFTGNRLALIQEGGYQVSHLAYATLGVLERVLGIETGVEDPFAWLTEEPAVATDAIAKTERTSQNSGHSPETRATSVRYRSRSVRSSVATAWRFSTRKPATMNPKPTMASGASVSPINAQPVSVATTGMA
jgi:hypothetical protein